MQAKVKKKMQQDPPKISVQVHTVCALFAGRFWMCGFLCATSVFSVTLWLLYLEFLQPQSHREHRGCTEKNDVVSFVQGHH